MQRMVLKNVRCAREVDTPSFRFSFKSATGGHCIYCELLYTYPILIMCVCVCNRSRKTKNKKNYTHKMVTEKSFDWIVPYMKSIIRQKIIIMKKVSEIQFSSPIHIFQIYLEFIIFFLSLFFAVKSLREGGEKQQQHREK